MRVRPARPWGAAVALTALLTVGMGSTEARAQSAEELKQQIQELERSTREQVEALKRRIEAQETQRTQERRAQEDRESTVQMLKEQIERQQVALAAQEQRVGRFLDGWENFFDLQAGGKQSNNDPSPLGKSIQGNVYAGDQFKIRLGGSLRLHVQHNDTPVGESVSSALLPDTTVPGGGNNGGRDNFRAFAGRTRLNLAIDGPVTLGGKTQGLLEFDFNRQFTFSLAYNHTLTHFKRVNALGGSESRENENNKVELIVSQYELSAGRRGRSEQWLREGMAGWIAARVLERLGEGSFARHRDDALRGVRGVVSQPGGLDRLVTYFQAFAASDNRLGHFRRVFGISLSDFEGGALRRLEAELQGGTARAAASGPEAGGSPSEDFAHRSDELGASP